MILKKVKNRKGEKNKPIWQTVNDLADYAISAKKKEKVLFHGSENFISETFNAQKKEMISLSLSNKKVIKPVQHWIFSWKEGEQPNQSQAIESINIFLEEMQLLGHQYIYGMHQDTHNLHLHLVVNRICPETNKSIFANKGFDLETGHKVIAKIEKKQGWEPEKNSRYEYVDGEFVRVNRRKKTKGVKQEAIASEINTGEKSSIRIGQERIIPILSKVNNWKDFHAALQEQNIRFEKKGSGGVFHINGITIKGYSIARKCTMKSLVSHLGEYQKKQEVNINGEFFTHKPAKYDPHQAGTLTGNSLRKLSQCHLVPSERGIGQNQSSARGLLQSNARPNRQADGDLRWGSNRNGGRKPEPVSRVNRLAWKEYSAQRREYFKGQAEGKRLFKNLINELREIHKDEFSELYKNLGAERKEQLGGSWKGKGKQLNALRSVIAARQAVKKQDLKEKQKKEKKSLSAEYKKKFPGFPSFEEWLRERGLVKEADKWRYERQEDVIYPMQDAPKSEDGLKGIMGFVFKIDDYGNVNYLGNGQDLFSFVDKGNRIVVNASRDYDAVLAALQLASQKWYGKISVNGSADYKALCKKIADENGIKIFNPELEEREKDMQENKDTNDKIKNFEAYYNAINSDRVRLTCIKMFENGEQKTFILDKEDGMKNGYPGEKIIEKMPKLLRLENRGENIYYTPLSDKKHHLVIDDMDKERLAKFMKDGFQPAVILESSPGNYQALITIGKLGTSFDRDVANRLAERLNKEYGDPNFYGCIHPHRAPGFCNQKPKHKKEDGSFPEVKLIKAERIECQKTLDLSVKIDSEYKELDKKRKQKMYSYQREHAPGNIDAAYFAHLDNIRQNIDISDPSRVDSMIALRLRATGHSYDSILGAIEKNAPLWRESQEGRNWTGYAQRTTNYAFGLAGDRDLNRFTNYVDHWKRIESGEEKRPRKARRSRA